MKFNEFEISVEDFKALLDIFVEGLKRIKIPKNKKNKIGIIVAIKTENNSDKIKLENDFISEFNNYLINSGEGDKFYIFKLSDKITNQINDKIQAHELLVRARAHFIVWGNISQRKIKSNLNYIFKLHGMVRHKPIPKIMQSKFQTEFSELLPSKFLFLESDEALGFELTQQWIGYTTKYIIGIAAFVSNDIKLADRLFSELEKEVNNIPDNESIPVIFEIKKRIPIRLSEVNLVYIARNYEAYVKSRDKKYLLSCRPFLKKLSQNDPGNYSARLIRAMVYFFENNTTGAINELKNIHDAPDITWRYSLGFLYAFNGDIDNALENYKKTIHKLAPSNICIDSEVFISDVIKECPEKIQLYFFRGLLNYKIKRDYFLAKEDFLFFLKNNKKNNFERLIELSTKYLSEIENNLGSI